jgi:integrase
LFLLALTLGLRRGELIGLRWSEVDLEGRGLHVRRGVQRVNGALAFVEPKTHRSRRPIPLPQLVIRALERHRAVQAAERLAMGSRWHDEGLVFTSPIGTVLDPRNVTRAFEDLRDAAGLPWLRLHDLRHACATFLLAQGVEPRTVMEVMGHSSSRLTMDLYGHVLGDRLHAAADAMDRAMTPKEESSPLATSLATGPLSEVGIPVETRGIEPLTPALQRRCSAN